MSDWLSAAGCLVLVTIGLVLIGHLDRWAKRPGGYLDRARRSAVDPLLKYLIRNVRRDMTQTEQELFVIECCDLTGWPESRARSVLEELKREPSLVGTSPNAGGLPAGQLGGFGA